VTERASKGISVALLPRRAPLPACAAVATGAASRALARRLLEEPDERLAALRGLTGDSLLAVLGAAEALPWVDGVLYLGSDPDAPRLLLPTTAAPEIAPALFEAAVLTHVARCFAAEAGARRGAQPLPPFAVMDRPRWVFSLAGAASIQRARLIAWLEAAP
jgi:MoxR-vWA-beta-propeller ternary system domain bpX5